MTLRLSGSLALWLTLSLYLSISAELRGYFEAALASIGAQAAVPARGAQPPQRLGDGSVVHFAPQYTIASVHLRSARVWDLMRHPKLVALVTDILGPDVVGWGAHLFAKLPHDPMRVSFHQDAVYILRYIPIQQVFRKLNNCKNVLNTQLQRVHSIEL